MIISYFQALSNIIFPDYMIFIIYVAIAYFITSSLNG